MLLAIVSANQAERCSVIPSVGQAPRRRKVCADTAPTSRAAAAPIDVVDFMANATESEIIHRTPKRCDREPWKATGHAFIAPTASDLHTELFAVLGDSQHMRAIQPARVHSSPPRAGRLCCRRVGELPLAALVQCSSSLTAQDQPPNCQDQTCFRWYGSTPRATIIILKTDELPHPG